MDLELALGLVASENTLRPEVRATKEELGELVGASNQVNRATRTAASGFDRAAQRTGFFRQAAAAARSTTQTLLQSLRSTGTAGQFTSAGLQRAGAATATLARRAQAGLVTARTYARRLVDIGRAGAVNVVRGLAAAGRGITGFRAQAVGAEAQARGLTTTLRALAVVAGTLFGLFATVSLASLIGDFGTTIVEAERLRGSLLSATGGLMALSDQAFIAIEQFAARTPFALNQSVEAFIKMQNLGISPTEERLTAFGNTSAAMGRDLNQMIEAVADAATGEFERLKEFGIKAKQQGENVSFTFQGVSTTVGKTSDEIVGYLTSIGNTRFAGAMAAQMQRLPGLLSNLRDNVDGIWRDIGEAGFTGVLERWLAAGIRWTGEIRDNIRAGWFDWVRTELSVQAERFRSWGDLARQYFNGALEVLGRLRTLISDNGDKVSFLVESVATLPVNIRTLAAIAIGESDKLVAQGIRNAEVFVNNLKLAWETFTFGVERSVSTVQLMIGRMVETAVRQYGNLVSQAGAALSALNDTSLGDALVSDSALATIQSAAVAMQTYSAITDDAKQDLAALNAEHAENVVQLKAERAGIEAKAATRRAAADEFIGEALRERDAQLKLRDERVAAARAAADDAKATFEANKARQASVATLDDVADALNKLGEARKFDRTELDKLLDKLDPARVAQREHTADLKTLREALAANALSQAEFNQRVGELDAVMRKAVGGVLSEAEILETAWKRGIERMDDAGLQWTKSLLKTGKADLSELKNFIDDWLAELVFSFARNKLVLSITGNAQGQPGRSGSGFNLDNFVGGGDLSGVLNKVTGFFKGGGDSLTPVSVGTQTGVDGLNFATPFDGGAGLPGESAFSFTQGIGGAITSAGAAFASKYLADEIFGDTSGIGSTLGGVVGTYFGGPIGSAIGSFVGSGLEKGLGKVFGFGKNNGDNQGVTTFDFATGQIDARGIGKTFDPANRDRSEALVRRLAAIAEGVGGSSFSGDLQIGNRTGITLDGESFSSDAAFLAEGFERVIEGADNLDESVRDLALGFTGTIDQLERQLGDAIALRNALGETDFFSDVEGFEANFAAITGEFQQEGEAIGQTLTRLNVGLALLEVSGESATRSIDNMRQAQAIMNRVSVETGTAILSVTAAIGDGLRSQFSILRAVAAASNRDILDTQIANTRELIAVYDGSAAATRALANATLARRDTEIALLTEIDAVTASITGRIASFREELILDGLDDEGQYERFREQIASLGEEIRNASTASQIDRFTQQAEQLTRSAFGLLDEPAQDEERQAFLEYLDQLQALAEGRLQELEANVVETSDAVDAETQRVVWEKAGLAGETLQSASEQLQAAAEAQESNSAQSEATLRQMQSTARSMESLMQALRNSPLFNGASILD